MNEALFFDGEDRANLYEEVVRKPDTPSRIEDALAIANGGDPVEWIPEAEEYARIARETLLDGGNISVISGKPETEGMFAGYHKVVIPLFDVSGDEPRVILRTLYATVEQVAHGRFTAPLEGVFCVDSEN